MDAAGFHFTNRWFDSVAKSVWDQLVPRINPTRILEIGAYEGASTCYLIDRLARDKPIEITCIDTWQGGVEHRDGGTAKADMAAVERRFHANTATAINRAAHQVGLTVHKDFSDRALVQLLAAGKAGSFDFIYIDGSHEAPDVLCDAVLAFRLLRVAGIIVFDDYLWQEKRAEGPDPVRSPKMAIDAFTTAYCRKLKILQAPLYQLYVQKTAD